MKKVEDIFYKNITQILNDGYNSAEYEDIGKVRTVYKDGQPAHYRAIHQVFESYNIAQDEFPITCLDNIAYKKAIGEILWIYQDASNDLDLLKNKYNISWWDNWALANRTIGQCYGATIARYDLMNQLLDGLKNNPFGRRHIINLFQYQDLSEDHALDPCAFETIWSVRPNKPHQQPFLDMTLIQRSSDYLMAGFINKIQYVALLMMVARHCGYRVGTFSHFVQNLHIYDRHIKRANDLRGRYLQSLVHYNDLKGLSRRIAYEDLPRDQTLFLQQPKLVLNPNKTNFYDFEVDDFTIIDHDPLPDFPDKLEIAI